MSFSKSLRFSLPVVTTLAVVASLGLALAQEKPKFEPQVGQPGRDVIWVPTAQTMVNRMLDLAKVTPSDVVIDLGSGDGRTVITAAKRGATAIGVEFNPDMVALSRAHAEKEGVSGRATFIQGDLFAQDLSKATVITMFLLPSINLKLRPTILDLRPGTRIVSNSFTMGEWRAEETSDVQDDCTTYCRAHLWVVPAKVEGNWKLPDGSLRLEQEFQMLTGTLQRGSEQMYIDGRMLGDQISFVAGKARYTGRVTGNAIDGLSQQTDSWRAHRSK